MNLKTHQTNLLNVDREYDKLSKTPDLYLQVNRYHGTVCILLAGNYFDEGKYHEIHLQLHYPKKLYEDKTHDIENIVYR